MDDDDFAEQVAGVAALAEPARRTLFTFVAAQDDAVSREQAAEGSGLPLHSAKFHLDRLVEEGLLEVEFRRLSGRTGPGAGRPSKMYRRSAREVSVSLPQRCYDLAAGILADGVDAAARSGPPVREAVAEAATREGRAIATSTVTHEARPTGLDLVAQTLAPYGYEPRVADHDLTLANCPFDRLASRHTDLVCGMNLSLVGGVVAGLGCTGLECALQPDANRCCVVVSDGTRRRGR